MTQQTNAQRLADELQRYSAPGSARWLAAEELRRLDAENKQVYAHNDELRSELSILTLAHDQLRAQVERLQSEVKPTIEDNSQNWAGMDGATAWHLIERHSENWGDIGKMMHEWLSANQKTVGVERLQGGEPVAWMHAGGHVCDAFTKSKLPSTFDDFNIPLYTAQPAAPAMVALTMTDVADVGLVTNVIKPFTPAQRRRLWDNSKEHHKDAAGFTGFERIATLIERAHGIGQPVGGEAQT